MELHVVDGSGSIVTDRADAVARTGFFVLCSVFKVRRSRWERATRASHGRGGVT
jgi:hypothetical protein